MINLHDAILFKQLNEEHFVQCLLCAHYCKIESGKMGKCRTRYNKRGRLKALTWGKARGLAIDPVEKKPFFHFMPGSHVLSFGTNGCNLRCKNCQNSTMSQNFYSYPSSENNDWLVTPQEIKLAALLKKADAIAYTYSEPTIFFEYAYDVIKACKNDPQASHMKHMFVSNGYFGEELLKIIDEEKLLDAVNIDLKFLDDAKYKNITGGTLQPVLDNIRTLFNLSNKIHIEIINLVIPDENDSPEDFDKLFEFILSVSPEIPLHLNRFYPNYRMLNTPPTDPQTLLNAREKALEMGLKNVYIGNMLTETAQNTYCSNCGKLLIEREGYNLKYNAFQHITEQQLPKCPECGTPVYLKL